MRERVTIFAGLALFVVLAAFPIWYTVLAGGGGSPPDLELPDPSDRSFFEQEEDYHCVEENMVARHMGILNDWRNAVVRGDGGQRYHESEDFPGKRYKLSLTGTCMGCHASRERFCYRCHEYANVLPLQPLQEASTVQSTPRGIGCWDCHVESKGD